jgi:hypothetical protein
LDAVPQQWSMSYIPRNTALFNDKWNSSHPPAIAFTRSHSVQLLALTDLKTGLEGNCFVSKEEIQQNMTASLTAVPREDFQRSFPQWHYSGNHARAEEACFDNNNILFTTNYAQVPGTFWSSHVSHTACHQEETAWISSLL